MRKERGLSWRVRALLAAMGTLGILEALCLFVVPGMKFSGVLCACLLIACGLELFLGGWAKWSDVGRICHRVFLLLLVLGVILFCAVEIYIVRGSRADETDAVPKAVIVLGAGVNGTTPSLALQSRIDAAEAYLERYPEVPAVLSGGQGAGEDISEAQAMYNALTADGIDPARLILEEQSTSTAENFRYSIALLDRREMDSAAGTVAVVTNDFHLCRARLLGSWAGIGEVVGVPAELPYWWLSVNYYAREVFALGKTILVSRLG